MDSQGDNARECENTAQIFRDIGIDISSDIEKEAIHRNFKTVVRDLELKEIQDELYQEKALGSSTFEEIINSSNLTQSDKNRKTLFILMHKRKEICAMKKFISALKESHPHLAEKIETTMNKLRKMIEESNGSTAATTVKASYGVGASGYNSNVTSTPSQASLMNEEPDMSVSEGIMGSGQRHGVVGDGNESDVAGAAPQQHLSLMDDGQEFENVDAPVVPPPAIEYTRSGQTLDVRQAFSPKNRKLAQLWEDIKRAEGYYVFYGKSPEHGDLRAGEKKRLEAVTILEQVRSHLLSDNRQEANIVYYYAQAVAVWIILKCGPYMQMAAHIQPSSRDLDHTDHLINQVASNKKLHPMIAVIYCIIKSDRSQRALTAPDAYEHAEAAFNIATRLGIRYYIKCAEARMKFHEPQLDTAWPVTHTISAQLILHNEDGENLANLSPELAALKEYSQEERPKKKGFENKAKRTRVKGDTEDEEIDDGEREFEYVDPPRIPLLEVPDLLGMSAANYEAQHGEPPPPPEASWVGGVHPGLSGVPPILLNQIPRDTAKSLPYQKPYTPLDLENYPDVRNLGNFPPAIDKDSDSDCSNKEPASLTQSRQRSRNVSTSRKGRSASHSRAERSASCSSGILDSAKVPPDDEPKVSLNTQIKASKNTDPMCTKTPPSASIEMMLEMLHTQHERELAHAQAQQAFMLAQQECVREHQQRTYMMMLAAFMVFTAILLFQAYK